jgi:hypothetical protein
MHQYDPNDDLPVSDWTALDEDEQVMAVRQYHEEAGIDVPNLDLHAILHTIIENQVALEGETPVPDALDRLQDEGLSRHDAIHAVATVLMKHLDSILDLAMQPGAASDSFDVEGYYRDVRTLTKDDWLNMMED